MTDANTLTRGSKSTLNSTATSAIGISSGRGGSLRAAAAAIARTTTNATAIKVTARNERYTAGR